MKTIILAALALFSAVGFAKVEVKVELFPAGSFEAVTENIDGMGVLKGGVYTAKEIKVAVKDLKTGIALRDEHLHEKLAADKHPHVIAKDVWAKGGKGKAKLEIMGKSYDVKLDYKDLGDGKAHAVFKMDLKQIGIDGISYMGVGVQDEIEIHVTIPYKKA